LVNRIVTPLTRHGLSGRNTYLLSVPGRRTARRYSTPVTLLVEGDARWLVSPYGERSWVKNARAAGWVELSRAGRSERLVVSELPPAEAAGVLRSYMRRYRVTRPFFDAKADDPLELFVEEAPRHPVFSLAATASPLVR
jgi:deazaflavin-dependent oxidoreductase (nitroreductase family)